MARGGGATGRPDNEAEGQQTPLRQGPSRGLSRGFPSSPPLAQEVGAEEDAGARQQEGRGRGVRLPGNQGPAGQVIDGCGSRHRCKAPAGEGRGGATGRQCAGNSRPPSCPHARGEVCGSSGRRGLPRLDNRSGTTPSGLPFLLRRPPCAVTVPRTRSTPAPVCGAAGASTWPRVPVSTELVEAAGGQEQMLRPVCKDVPTQYLHPLDTSPSPLRRPASSPTSRPFQAPPPSPSKIPAPSPQRLLS